MSERFIKFIPSSEMRYLARKHPNAFILLTFIADRARFENGHADGLLFGECHIGDYKEYGLTEKEYRTAKKILVERNHIEIIETCRSRKNEKNSKSTLNFENREKWADKRATKTTTIGTLVKICSSNIYDINNEKANQQKGDRKGDRGATEGRPKGDEQDIYKITSSYEEDNQEIAQSATRLRSKDFLTFDFNSWQFNGISDQDRISWKSMFCHLDLDLEIIKATQWLKANPSKNNKKLWRKFLTGWFQRANDYLENKKAFRNSSGANNQDRTTKDINGNTIENPHTGRF